MTIRDDFERLAQRGPHRDPAAVLAAVLESTRAADLKETNMTSPAVDLAASPKAALGRRRRVASTAVVVALAVTGVATTMLVVSDDGAQTTASDDGRGPDGSLSPTATLPVTDDLTAVPVTVPDSSFSWYRIAPDLDLAWNASTASEPQLCWRTPVDQACEPDSTPPLGRFVTIPTAGDQTLVLVWAPEGVAGAADAVVTLSDGAIQRAPVDWGDGIGIGVARFRSDDDAIIQEVDVAPV